MVNVKPGYARNYLIPKGFAIFASDSNKKIREENLRQKAFKEEKLRNEAEDLKAALEPLTVKVAAKTGTSGKIFGSVNALQISDGLKEQHNMEIDRKKIEINSDTIKEIGSYEAIVKIYKDIQATIKIEVVGE